MTNYAGMADTRATQVLKWSIANKRDVAYDEELKSEVTTALVVTGLILPIVLVVGGIIVWYAPYITQADKEHYNLIRITCSFLVLALVISKVFNLFESVLRGMNLGYKRMGLRAGIVAVSGGLKVLAITQGYGLVGLSIIEVFTAVIIGTTFYIIVKQNIGWFGFGTTNFSKVVSYGKLSGWFMAFTGSKMFLLHSDKIILGYIIGPIFVTKYTITMFTSYALQGLVNAVITGVIPGIGSLYGRGEYHKVIQARKIIISLNWLLATCLGVTILLLNRSFIGLWVGEEHYAGTFENLLIILVSIQIIFFQIDSLIINVTLNMKKKVLFSSIASLLTISIAYFLVEKYLIVGLCISILLGRAILTIGYPFILKEKMQEKQHDFSLSIIRPSITCCIFFLIAAYSSQWIDLTNWLQLITAGVVSVLFIGVLYWRIGLSTEDRIDVWKILSNIKLFKKEGKGI